MIKRLYINNFRCLDNFTLAFGEGSRTLLLGRNGMGKSTVLSVLSLFQRIGCGESSVSKLIDFKDFAFSRLEIPIRFELDVVASGHQYAYSLALELPKGGKKMRVFDECLDCDGVNLYRRDRDQVTLRRGHDRESQFSPNWFMVALPLVQTFTPEDPIEQFKRILSEMILISPAPSAMRSSVEGDDAHISLNADNAVGWLASLLAMQPGAYGPFVLYLKKTYFPDLDSFRIDNPDTMSRKLVMVFTEAGRGIVEVAFDDLSDGEKCIFLAAVVVVRNRFLPGLVCFWDEPDNYLSTSEVANFITRLRKSFAIGGGQLLMTSHNVSAIRLFQDTEIKVLMRDTHLEPVRCRELSELQTASEDRDSLITRLLTGGLYHE